MRVWGHDVMPGIEEISHERWIFASVSRYLLARVHYGDELQDASRR